MEIKPTSFARGVPASERNGFFGLEPDLMERCDEQFVAVVVFEVDEVVSKQKRGERYPVVKMIAVEPLLDSDAAASARRMLRKAAEKRTGALPLPVEGDEVAS